MRICMYVCMYLRTYVCMFVCTCMYVTTAPMSRKLKNIWNIISASKHDRKHSRRSNSKQPFFIPEGPASTRSAAAQTLDTPWSNNPIGHKAHEPLWRCNLLLTHRLNPPAVQVPLILKRRRSRRSSRPQANPSEQSNTCTGSLTESEPGTVRRRHFRRRQRRAPPLRQCIGQTIGENRCKQAFLVDFRPRLVGSGLVVARRRHQLQRCLHDVLAGGRDHRRSPVLPI